MGRTPRVPELGRNFRTLRIVHRPLQEGGRERESWRQVQLHKPSSPSVSAPVVGHLFKRRTHWTDSCNNSRREVRPESKVDKNSPSFHLRPVSATEIIYFQSAHGAARESYTNMKCVLNDSVLLILQHPTCPAPLLHSHAARSSSPVI